MGLGIGDKTRGTSAAGAWEEGADGVERVGVGRVLVLAVATDAREPQRDATRVAGRRLRAVERDLDDQLRPLP